MQRERTFFRGRKWLAAALSCLLVMGLSACGGGGGEEGGGGKGTPEMAITPAPTGDHPDTIASAAAIAAGETVDGSIDSPDDEDFFRLDVPEGTSVIDITLRAEAGVEVALLDGDGNVLGVAETVEETTSQAGGAGPVTAAASPAAVPLLVAVALRVALPHASRATAKYLIRLAATPQGRAILLKAKGQTARLVTKLGFRAYARVGAIVEVAGTTINLIRGIPDAKLRIGGVPVRIDLRQHYGANPPVDPSRFRYKITIGTVVHSLSAATVLDAIFENVGLNFEIEGSIMTIDTASGSEVKLGSHKIAVAPSLSVRDTEGVFRVATIPPDLFTFTIEEAPGTPNGGMQPGEPPQEPTPLPGFGGGLVRSEGGASCQSAVATCPTSGSEFASIYECRYGSGFGLFYYYEESPPPHEVSTQRQACELVRGTFIIHKGA